MAPLLGDGDYVLLRRYSRSRPPRSGDVACIARVGQPLLIKRLAGRHEDGRFRLSGDGAASAPSIDLGLAAEHEIIGWAVISVSGNRVRVVR